MVYQAWFGPNDTPFTNPPGELILPDSDFGKSVGYSAEFFESEKNWLFRQDQTIFISCIESRNEGKGFVRNLFKNLLNKRFIIKIPNPLGKMVILVRKWGFVEDFISVFLPGFPEEKVEVWTLTPEKYFLPKVRGGCTGYSQESNQFRFNIFSESGKLVIEENLKAIPEDLQLLYGNLLAKCEEKWQKSKKFQKDYPKGFHFILMPQGPQCGDLFRTWYDSLPENTEKKEK